MIWTGYGIAECTCKMPIGYKTIVNYLLSYNLGTLVSNTMQYNIKHKNCKFYFTDSRASVIFYQYHF